MTNVFVLSTTHGTRSVHRTPQGAYKAAQRYVKQQIEMLTAKLDAGVVSPWKFYGEYGIVDKFQEMTAEEIAHDVALILKNNQWPVAPMYFVCVDDALNQTKRQIVATIDYVEIQE